MSCAEGEGRGEEESKMQGEHFCAHVSLEGATAVVDGAPLTMVAGPICSGQSPASCIAAELIQMGTQLGGDVDK